MLEILLLFKSSRKLLEMAKDRGIAGWPFVILLIILWFGGEVAGAVAGFIFLGAPNNDGFNFGVYICAIVGAVIGAGVTFGIMAAIPKSTSYYGDEFDRPNRNALDDEEFDRAIRPRDPQGLDDPRFRDRPN
jgi:hypothetical protein